MLLQLDNFKFKLLMDFHLLTFFYIELRTYKLALNTNYAYTYMNISNINDDHKCTSSSVYTVYTFCIKTRDIKCLQIIKYTNKYAYIKIFSKPIKYKFHLIK